MNIKFRFHALSRMFERNISEADVLQVLTTGKVIEDYPNDQPYPSCLRLGFVKNRPLHVVTAEATDEATTVIITVYEPDLHRWNSKRENKMKCIVCKHGQTKPGTMTTTLERADTTIVIKEVPAEVCDNCGEEYLSQEIAAQLLKQAEEAVKAGIQVDVRKFKSAA